MRVVDLFDRYQLSICPNADSRGGPLTDPICHHDRGLAKRRWVEGRRHVRHMMIHDEHVWLAPSAENTLEPCEDLQLLPELGSHRSGPRPLTLWCKIDGIAQYPIE